MSSEHISKNEKDFMCGAIDTRLGAISSGAVHSRVGACDPRGLFAKRVLHDDSHQENMVYD